MSKQHKYELALSWTGNNGVGTKDYKAYERSHRISINGKPELLLSSDPAFRGDPARHNPEELLLTSLSSCHMLWYLHLCAESGVVVVDYIDNAEGSMETSKTGEGRFKEVTLHPVVTVSEKAMIKKANELHKKANTYCFIANSVNFEVLHVPVCKVVEGD